SSLAKTGYIRILCLSPRRFDHETINELPESVSVKPWAGGLLRVIERATQARPADRYQNVQDFWDDLSDIALPQTKPLEVANTPATITQDLRLETAVVTEAPPNPRFETSKELQHEATGKGADRTRIEHHITGKQ